MPVIIAEGHVEMTLRFSICSEYAVTLKAIKTGNFLHRELSEYQEPQEED